MSIELQERAKAFLERPVPKSIPYVSDTEAEKFIKMYAKKGRLPNDDETDEQLELTCMESTAIAEKVESAEAPDEVEYLKEIAAILESIRDEG